MLTRDLPDPPAPATVPMTVIVMAKAAVPGRVKTRLTVADPQFPELPVLSPTRAAEVHLAMMHCVLERVNAYMPDTHKVLALDDIAAFHAHQGNASTPPPHNSWQLVTQSPGSLGDRLDHAWQHALLHHPDHAVMFLGVDCPDVPGYALQQARKIQGPAGASRELSGALRDDLGHFGAPEALIGPVSDGGYWTLVSRRFSAALLDGIDWGTASVYDQTHAAARSANLRLADLPPWHDVDSPGDLAALLRRLDDHLTQHPPASPGHDPALATLRESLRHTLSPSEERDKSRR